MDIVRLAKLLNDLVTAKTIYDLVKRGHNPKTLYKALKWLVEHSFVNVVERDGKKLYHLTGLGAEFLKILRKALIYRVTKYLEERGIRYRVWWGDERIRAVRPVIYVDRPVELPLNFRGLIEVRIAGCNAAQGEDEGIDRKRLEPSALLRTH